MNGTTNDLDGHADFLQHTLLYCVISRVTGIPAGIYRYNPERHELEPVRTGLMQSGFYQALAMPQLNMLPNVTFFPVGNYMHGFQVYGDRWYRMQNMEAGIIAQRLYLAAAALKLGCRASLGFSVPGVNAFLGLPDAKDNQYMSLIQIMVAPEQSAYRHYEQSLLI
jgi:SagB-type dehydrogenase family enzyme